MRRLLITLGLAGAFACGLTATAHSAAILTAGDIQDGTGSPTAPLLAATPHDAIWTLGDNQYTSGTLSEYQTEYDKTWGPFKAKTYAISGNHEHKNKLAGFCAYFATGAAIDPCVNSHTRPFYAVNIGDWRLYAIDTGDEDPWTAEQRAFFAADVAANPHLCQAVISHHPRYSGGHHGNSDWLAADWALMMANKVDLVLQGHDHNYQRWARMNSAGAPDEANGIRSFVVGTGGKSHYTFSGKPTGLEVSNTDTFGVLGLNLKADGYDWAFIPEAGKTFTDTGTEACR